jgi:hypothetical protein
VVSTKGGTKIYSNNKLEDIIEEDPMNQMNGTGASLLSLNKIDLAYTTPHFTDMLAEEHHD